MNDGDIYFNIYTELLRTIQRVDPITTRQLLGAMQPSQIITQIIESHGTRKATEKTIRTLDNLINDGLVNGSKIETKEKPEYELAGLTTNGYKYLSALENDTTINKIKNYLKDDGLPITPQAISKAIARIVL